MKKFLSGHKLLVIAVAGIVIFSFFAAMMQNSFGRVSTRIYNNRTLTEIAEEITSNSEKSGKSVTPSFTTSDIYKMTYKILRPKNASANNPAPAIVVMHGGLSNKDTYAPIYLELARRGFVVVAFDAMGHGKTDMQVDELTHNTMGMEAIVELTMSLPYVDVNNVAVTGHSWGNNGAVNTVNSINLGTENPRIRALLIAQGSLASMDLQEGSINNMIYGMSVGKYDEMDTLYWGSYTLAEGAWAAGWLTEIYPGYSETVAPLGEWYTADGRVALKEGEKINASEARILYNPANTHPAALFSTTATKVNINFFYGAFGTPNGARYINSGNQVWPIFIIFLFLALISWFLLGLALVGILLKTYSFKSIAEGAAALKEEDKKLPSFKDPRQWIPTIIMYVGLFIFASSTLEPLSLMGARVIPVSQFFPCAAHTASAYGFWSCIVAIVAACALIFFMYVKRFLYRKDGPEAVPNPFRVAQTNAKNAFYSIFLGFLVFAIMYGLLYVIEAIFGVNYVIADMDYTTVRMNKITVLFRYVWFFLPFYFVNAVMVANTRFKDLPEWVTVAIVAVGNVLGIAIWLIKEYTALLGNGALLSGDAATIGTTVWSMLLPMVMSPIIARYTYKKTGKIWLGVAINVFIFTMSLIGTGQYMTYPITLLGL